MIRIAVTGPESTGKTTLSCALADHFQAPWHREYAREYLNRLQRSYTYEDLSIIAQKQMELRNSESYDQLVIHDTENLVLRIWAEFNYKKCPTIIEQLLSKQVYDHYFLCSPDGIDWEADPLREHPEQRETLFEIYERYLEDLPVQYTVLKGTLDDRLNIAIAIIDDLLLSKGGFCV